MKTMHVLVLPSRTGEDWKEQFGQVLIEAMSCGTPVVGSDSGAIPAVIGDAGMIFKEGDAKDLAEKLKNLMNESFRESLRKKGLNRVDSCFTHEKVAAATHEVYRYLLEGNRPEPFSY
jgi:glycosyltransferase involved in cell wall biosynthesis